MSPQAAAAAAASSPGPAKPQQVSAVPDKEQQVKHIKKLLDVRGDKGATEIRRRIESGSGVTAKGVLFGTDVLKAALEQWCQERAAALEHAAKAAAAPCPPHGNVSLNNPPCEPAEQVKPDLGGADMSCGGHGGDQNLPPQLSRVPPAKRPRPSIQETESAPAAARRRVSAAVPPAASVPDVSSPTCAGRNLKRLPVGAADRASMPEVPPHSVRRAASRQNEDCNGFGSAAGATSAVGRADRDSGKGVGAACADPERDATAGASSAPATPSTPSPPPVPGGVKELKARLASHGLDFSGCVEKADLESLWRNFEELRSRPLEELRKAFAAAAGAESARAATADECARGILSRAGAAVPETAAPAPQTGQPTGGSAGEAFGNASGATSSRGCAAGATSGRSSAGGATNSRSTAGVNMPRAGSTDAPRFAPAASSEARDEVNRVLSYRRESFRSLDAWGFAVLGCNLAIDRTLSAVQSKYRCLMKKLHPDKVGELPGMEKAVEAVKQAKDACEKKLNGREPPGQPRDLHFKVVNDRPGHRRIRLHWSPPEERERSQLKRYVVQVFDPSYGKFLTVTVLEPDYSEELRRYVSLEELCSYELAEEELQKMPSVFNQVAAQLQVAAANEAGSSDWSKICIPLKAVEGFSGGALSRAQATRATGPATNRGVSCGIQAANIQKQPRASTGNRKRK